MYQVLVFTLADFYEQMVKEYLEQQGYTAKLRVRFFKTRGYSDIDVLAINLADGKIIIGEVKAASLTKTTVQKKSV